jgi:outer membrane immunogenic protein
MNRTHALAAAALLTAPPALADQPKRWENTYIGAHMFAGFGQHDATPRFAPSFSVRIDQDIRGAGGGFVAGFSRQFGPWVAGLETTFSWTSIDGKASMPITGFGMGGPDTVHTKSDINWIATGVGRLGYAQGGILYFAKGGIAVMDFNFAGYSILAGTYLGGASAAGRRVGWTIGTGVEFALNPSWSARLDYDYADFGSKTYDFSGTPVRLEPSLHTFRGGLTYRLDLF